MVRAGDFIFDIVHFSGDSAVSVRGLIVLAASNSRILARPTDGSELVSYSAGDEGKFFFITKTDCLQECRRRNSLIT